MKPDTKAIRARAEAATPADQWQIGRWDGTLGRAMLSLGGLPTKVRWSFTAYGFGNAGSAHPDFIFVQHARADVEALCDRVEALEYALAEALLLADMPERNQDAEWYRRRQSAGNELEGK